MQETDINEHFLTAVLQISNSADPAQFLPTIYHQVPLADSVWFLTPIWHRMSNRFCQISDGNLATSFDITDFVRDLLLFCYQTLIAYSAQNLSLQVWLVLEGLDAISPSVPSIAKTIKKFLAWMRRYFSCSVIGWLRGREFSHLYAETMKKACSAVPLARSSRDAC